MDTKKLLAALALTTAIGAAAETPLWLRDVMISPKGDQIAFTYRGDIYTVPVGGGTARRLTATNTYESIPVWSPDGKKIAFATDRYGGQDIMIMSAEGGTAKRLTSNSAIEKPMAFTPDGKYVLYAATIQDPSTSIEFPSAKLTEVYRIGVDGGRPVQVLATPAEMVDYIPGGQNFVYQDQKGLENEWRKHHTSSVTRDIWMYDASKRSHTNLTSHAGEDRNPTVSPDGKTLYFLSERDGGSMNVYAMPMSGSANPVALTHFKNHPVRFLSQADNGTIAMAYDGEIYTMQPDGKPEKVKIDMTVDRNDTLTKKRFSRGQEAVVSPDGKQMAVVYRGDVFVTSVDHESMKQITQTPQAEADPCWSKDGNALYYTSQRDGHYNIYKATRTRDEDPNFSNATLITEEAVFPAEDKTERARPMISPDGKKMLFIEDRNKLMVMDLESKKVKKLTGGETYPQRDGGFNMEWGPDSKWIVLEIMARLHEPYSDIALLNTETGELINLTNSGYFDTTPHWAMDGKAILFKSERYGMRNHASWGSLEDAMLLFLTRDAYDEFVLSEEDLELRKELKSKQEKEKKEAEKDSKKDDGKKDDNKADEKTVKIDRKGLEDRVVRLTPNSSDLADAIMTADAETLYYLSAFEGGYDLWKASLRDDDVSLVKKLDDSSASFQQLPDGKLFIIGPKVRKLNPSGDKLTNVSFSGVMNLNPEAEREFMFDYVKNEEAERFYRTDMHGVDWDNLTEHYRRFLPHISNNYDFSEMLSELLGELNVSHTGSGYFAPGAQEPTASLGLLYDMTSDDDGLTVTEVIEKGPFDNATTAMTPGAVITAINGVAINPDTDWNALLNGISGKKTLITFIPKGAQMPVDEVVLPISQGRMNALLYNRWVKGREAYVDSISGGRLGYVHLQSMSDDAFRKAYSAVLGKFNDRDGIVIDTRWNGGGRLHEDVEILFSGQKYMTQVVRGVESCDMPSRRWNKPSVMVTSEANYSNAHGTPFVYQTRKLGKVVGAPVPGTMTSVNWQTLQDESMYFGIPVIGYRLDDGSYLENKQLEPDIHVLNTPEDVVSGRDTQLDVAVKTLLEEINAKKLKK